MKILIGLSGGVDSTVAALILKQQGYELIGATMSIWGKQGEEAIRLGHKNACYGPDELESIEGAKRISELLGIPYHVCNCVDAYEKIVLETEVCPYCGTNVASNFSFCPKCGKSLKD